MPANKPEEIHELFARALSDGDVHAVVSLYEREAILVPGSAQTVDGRDAIGAGLAVGGKVLGIFDSPV